jgi:tRNA threonylcarbamoyladenosine biosynthesis protein TsaB
MNKLYIDTRDNKKVIARLENSGKKFEAESTSENRHPESILLLIEKVCTDSGISIHEVDEIQVEEGPGSYTGLKVGASVANALGFSLDKKINGKKLGELVTPKYE